MSDSPKLGPFHLGAPIGRGGMAQVWSGHHDTLDVPVALKILDADPLDPRSQAESVRREVEAMAGLTSHHIVMVFDQGRVPADHELLPAGAPWIAMELATGTGLQRRADLTWSGVRVVLHALLDALAHAHARGVVHRDLKPSNVIVDGPSHHPHSVKLTDFGIATAAREGAVEGSVRGTPRYMAPEQFRNTTRDIGPWTDLYALGCLTWQLLTGAAPYQGKEPSRVAQQHLYEELPPFRPRVPVPAGLEAWLRRLLVKHPAWRYQRAADAACALTELCQNTELIPASKRSKHDVNDGEETLVGLLADDTDLLDTLSDFVLDAEPPRFTTTAPRRVERPPIPREWRDDSPAINPTRLEAAALSLYGLRVVPLIGRDVERDILWDEFLAAVDSGRPRAVLLEGPIGSGKSALATWFRERLHELGAAVTMWASHDRTPSTRHGLAPMLARELRIHGVEPADAIAEVDRLLTIYDLTTQVDAQSVVSVALPSAELPAPRLASERHAVAAQVVAMRCKLRPVLIWLDDILWSADSIRFVEHLLGRTRAPVMLVMGVQDEDLDKRPAARELLRELATRPEVTTLRLGPMAEHEVQDLVRHHIRVAKPLAKEVARRSRGNPLFAVQLLGDWVQRGLFQPGSDGFELRSDRHIPLPDHLHDVWAERLARLLEDSPPGSREALEIAAALGTTINHQEWGAVCAHAGLEPPQGLVGRLVRSRLALPAEDGWSFAHVMLRESIIHAARASGRWTSWNRHAADALPRSDVPDDLARVGTHLLEAEEPGRAIKPLFEASRRLLHRDEAPAVWPVLELLGVALDRCEIGQDDAQRATFDLLRCRALKARPDLDGANRLAGLVEEVARMEGWERLEAEALTEQADIARVRGDLPDAVLAFRRALDRYAALDDLHGVADSLRSLAHVAVQLGEAEHARHLLTEAQERYASLSDAQGEAMCLAGLSDIARVSRQWSEAINGYRAALGLFRQLGHRSGMALGLHGLAEVNRLTGHLDEAEDGYREVIHIDEAIGRDPSIPMLNLALCLISSHRYEDAEVTLEELEQRWRAENRPGYLAIAHVASLPCCAAREDWASWLEHVLCADELLHDTSVVDVDIAAYAELAGNMAHAVGRHELAEQAWQMALEQWTAMGDDERVSDLNERMQHL